MARRALFTILAVVLAGTAFDNADPVPDVNLFGVIFLAIAYIVWFFWGDIQAGYAYIDDDASHRQRPGLMLIRMGPMRLHELVAKNFREP